MPAAVVDQTGLLDLKEILTSLHYCAVEGSTSPYYCGVEGSYRRSGLLRLLFQATRVAIPRAPGVNLFRGGEF